ncbi:hypothetical protein P7D79_23265, partial [Enterococcus avium]
IKEVFMNQFTDEELALLAILAREGKAILDYDNRYDEFWFSKSDVANLVKKMNKIDDEVRDRTEDSE